MGDRDLVTFGAATAADVISAISIPGGNAIVSVTQLYIAKKRRDAAEILISELSNGFHGKIPFEDLDLDPLIEIVFRFSRAVESGTARENLRLIAQVVAGLKKNRALEGDRFNKWCSILEHLTRDEILVIGKACAIRRKINEDKTSDGNDFWQRLQPALEGCGFSTAEVYALCGSLARTGLIIPSSAFGGMVYIDTPWLKELGELADFEVGSRTGEQKGSSA